MPKFIITRDLVAFTFGNAEHGPIRQVTAVWFFHIVKPFGHVISGIYDKT